MLLAVEFLMHHSEGGEEIAEEEEEEGEAAHEHLRGEGRPRSGQARPRWDFPSIPSGPGAHLPLLALRVPGQVKQCQRIEELPEL